MDSHDEDAHVSSCEEAANVSSCEEAVESPREHQNGKSSDIVSPPKRKSDDLGDTPSIQIKE